MLIPKKSHYFSGREIYKRLDMTKIFKPGERLAIRKKAKVKHNDAPSLCSSILATLLELITEDMIDNGNCFSFPTTSLYTEYGIKKESKYADGALASVKFDNLDLFKLGERCVYKPKLSWTLKDKSTRELGVNIDYHRQRRINENVNNGMIY